MEIIKCYSDLCREIEIYEMRLESLIRQKDGIIEKWLKPISEIQGMDYSRPKVQENHITLDMDEHIFQMTRIEKDIEKYEKLLGALKDSQKYILNRIQQFEGLDYKVAYYRIVESKKLDEIAMLEHVSIATVKRISSRITKAMGA